MKKKPDNSNLIQWWISAGMLLVVVLVLLVWFANAGSRQERKAAEEAMVQELKTVAQHVDREFTQMQTYTRTVAACAARMDADTSDILKMVMETGGEQRLFDVIWCDGKGRGVRLADGEAETVEVPGSIYTMSSHTHKEYVLFTLRDDIHERAAVIIVEPVILADSSVNYLICYYDVVDLQWLITDRIFGSDVYFILMNEEGSTLSAIQNATLRQNPLCVLSGDYFGLLEDESGQPAAVRELRGGIEGRGGGLTYLDLDHDERVLVYAPVNFNEFTLLASVSRTYVDRAASEGWRIGRTLVIGLGIAFGLFMVAVIAINIIYLLRNRKKQQDLENKADTDLLTELLNKISTERKIKEHMAGHPKEQGLLFVLDVDNFKKINDTMGHAFGDEVLRTLGSTIRAEFRASDIIGRTGGDEFMLFLCNMKDENIIKMEAEKIERFFKNFQAGTYTKYSVTASIGAAVFPRDGANFEELYKAADKALYVAKKRGKNQLAFYGDEA